MIQYIIVNGIEENDLPNLDVTKYELEDLFEPYTIKHGEEHLAIIGLKNISWVNKRADLKLYIFKDISKELHVFISMVMEEYIRYVHKNNIYSLCTSASASDEKLTKVLMNSCMNFFSLIPFASVYNSKLEASLLFEHYPDMVKDFSIEIPSSESISLDKLKEMEELDEILYLKNGYKAISSQMLEVLNLDVNEFVKTHIEALQNRERFSIPLGEDKYIIQEGNGKYGISRAVQNFSYILIDNNFNYLGYCNILRKASRNASIDIAIIPKYQGMGLGSMLLEAFYNKLLESGYMSVTSYVFEFNKASNKMHSKLAKYNGTRKNSYYINGKLCDVNIYTKTKRM